MTAVCEALYLGLECVVCVLEVGRRERRKDL